MWGDTPAPPLALPAAQPKKKNNVRTSSRCFHKTQFLTCHCRLTKCQLETIELAGPPVGVAKQAAILKL
jgi:hypothetical protein